VYGIKEVTGAAAPAPASNVAATLLGYATCRTVSPRLSGPHACAGGDSNGCDLRVFHQRGWSAGRVIAGPAPPVDLIRMRSQVQVLAGPLQASDQRKR
jgi:hypothetical protein